MLFHGIAQCLREFDWSAFGELTNIHYLALNIHKAFSIVFPSLYQFPSLVLIIVAPTGST